MNIDLYSWQVVIMYAAFVACIFGTHVALLRFAPSTGMGFAIVPWVVWGFVNFALSNAGKVHLLDLTWQTRFSNMYVFIMLIAGIYSITYLLLLGELFKTAAKYKCSVIEIIMTQWAKFDKSQDLAGLVCVYNLAPYVFLIFML